MCLQKIFMLYPVLETVPIQWKCIQLLSSAQLLGVLYCKQQSIKCPDVALTQYELNTERQRQKQKYIVLCQQNQIFKVMKGFVGVVLKGYSKDMKPLFFQNLCCVKKLFLCFAQSNDVVFKDHVSFKKEHADTRYRKTKPSISVISAAPFIFYSIVYQPRNVLTHLYVCVHPTFKGQIRYTMTYSPLRISVL